MVLESLLNIHHQLMRNMVQSHCCAMYLEHILLLQYLCYLHFLHFIVMLSIHGRCNSKSGPSGRLSAESIISCLEKNQFFSPQSLQSHTGSGHPQILSRDIHQGCLSLIIPKNLFFGCSKKYSTDSLQHQLLVI